MLLFLKNAGNDPWVLDENLVIFRQPIVKKCLKQRRTICVQNTHLGIELVVFNDLINHPFIVPLKADLWQ